jgi:predicted nucleotidyltransferase
MNKQIQALLSRIEAEHNVRILYAAESGSRAWGFASPDSDYDVRFIYYRPIEEYLRLVKHHDVLDKMNGLEDICTDLMDFSGWDIYKACTLFRKSNPQMLEWINSPIAYRDDDIKVIYRSGETFIESLRTLAKTELSMNRFAFHYRSIANGNWEKYFVGKVTVTRKKYLYVLRGIFCCHWVQKYGTPPPVLADELIAGLDLDSMVLRHYEEIVRTKRVTGECSIASHIPDLDAWIIHNLALLRDLYPKEASEGEWVDEEKLNVLIRRVLGV